MIIHKNPSLRLAEYISAKAKRGQVKGFVDKNGNMYMWDAKYFSMTHDAVNYLGMEGNGPWDHFYAYNPDQARAIVRAHNENLVNKMPGVLQSVSPYYQLRLEYWQALRERLINSQSILRSDDPWPGNGYSFKFRKGVSFWAGIFSEQKYIHVNFTLTGPNRFKTSLFLFKNKIAIEREMRFGVYWHFPRRIITDPPEEELKHTPPSIRLYKMETDCRDRADWGNQHEWFQNAIESFYNVFSKYLDLYDQHSVATTVKKLYAY